MEEIDTIIYLKKTKTKTKGMSRKIFKAESLQEAEI